MDEKYCVVNKDGIAPLLNSFDQPIFIYDTKQAAQEACNCINGWNEEYFPSLLKDIKITQKRII